VTYATDWPQTKKGVYGSQSSTQNYNCT
jgi:hypothetical protein